VDLRQRRILSWTRLDGVQPNWFGRVRSHGRPGEEAPEFIAAMKKRDIGDLNFVDCMALPPGYFGGTEERGRRIAHVQCRDVRGARNTWTREIGGLTAVVDLNTKQVLRIVDEGVTPVAKTVADYDPATIGRAREVRREY
jgi:primary-amine oxidase